MKKVLFVAAEGLPFVKSGGLADVVGSLPKALAQEGVEVSVVLPLYSAIIKKHFNELKLAGAFKMKLGIYNADVRVFKHEIDEVKYYFIEHAGYFERDQLYGYSDDGERFAFYNHAVYQMCLHLEYYPDIIHSHDWHTGMMAVLGKMYYGNYRYLSDAKHVYTIHNIAYQGNFGKGMLDSCLDLPHYLYDNGALRFGDGISFMKAGIVYADKVTTVSQTYAKEILTSEYGENLEGVLRLRAHDLVGIVNGIDVESNDPKTDHAIFRNYDISSIDQKVKNKVGLQQQLGLRVAADVCLIGMVGRLAHQKGISLVLDKMRDIMGLDIQLVVLGTGEPAYEHDFARSEDMYKRRMVYYGGYSDEIARKIYAGADFFLMPSQFEPCGLSQMHAMRYGTIPIVRETGGLKETVEPYNEYEKKGTGFTFKYFSSEDMYHVLRMAVSVYYLVPDDIKMLQHNAMMRDFSWNVSAKKYAQLYSSIL